jgi:hypothetical protein
MLPEHEERPPSDAVPDAVAADVNVPKSVSTRLPVAIVNVNTPSLIVIDDEEC